MAIVKYVGDRYAGLSTDTKPTGGLTSGAHFEELDTFRTYSFVTGGWVWTNNFTASGISISGNAALCIGDVTFIIPEHSPSGDEQYYLEIATSGLIYLFGQNQLTVSVNGITQILNSDYNEDSGVYYPTGTAILLNYDPPAESAVNVKVTSISGEGAAIGGVEGGNTFDFYTINTGTFITASGNYYTGCSIVSGDFYTGTILVSGDYYTGIFASGNYYTGCTFVSGNYYTGCIIASGDYYTGSTIINGNLYSGCSIITGNYITGGSGSGLFSGYQMIADDITIQEVKMIKVTGAGIYYTFVIS